MEYQFVWHDGGRAAAGYTGHTRDCAARAIAIATGVPYQEIYDEITEAQGVSPRNGTRGVPALLEKQGWKREECTSVGEMPEDLGVLIVSLSGRRSGHVATVIGTTLYDTWDCLSSTNVTLESFWWHPEYANAPTENLPKVSSGCRIRSRHDAEFQKVLSRLRKLDATASNAAATEGEVDNALRAMQAMLLQHNLTREDLDADCGAAGEGLTTQRIAVNGKNICAWESRLAWYITTEIFPLVHHYKSRAGKRSFYWFYGPVDDVEQCIELYRELLLTIATAAKVQYGTFRQSGGASYAEGFVDGLPRSPAPHVASRAAKQAALVVLEKSKQMQLRADHWLEVECGVRLRSGGSSYLRSSFDGAAHARGMRDGAKHDVGNQPKRLTHRK